MSILRFVNRGEVNVLNRALAGDFTLRLFTTDVTTGLTETEIDALDETDFTEATFTGYSAVTLTGGSWSTASSDPSRATYAQQTFTSAGGSPEDVWGYYLTDDNDSDSLAAFEQFDGPVVISNGDSLRITPRVNLEDGDNVTPTGIVVPFSGATAPTGWVMADGSAISRSGANAALHALYAAASYPYGNGNGTTTFNVPDLRQRFPLGKAASGTGVNLGDTGGAIDHTHDLDTATSHAKIFGTGSNPLNIRHDRKTVASYSTDIISAVTGAGATTTATTTPGETLGSALGGASGTNNPPFVALNYIVKL